MVTSDDPEAHWSQTVPTEREKIGETFSHPKVIELGAR
jgi:hypothetical protein